MAHINMRQLLLLFAFLLWAAMVSPIVSVCNLSECQNKIPSENSTLEEKCAQAKEAITCAQDKLLNNPECKENIKAVVRQRVETGRKQMQEECGAMASPVQSVCNFRECQNKIPSENTTKEEKCAQAKEAITCAYDKLLSNPNCKENIKSVVRQQVEMGRKKVQEECGGGATGLMASLVFCLGLSTLTCLVTFFQSRTS